MKTTLRARAIALRTNKNFSAAFRNEKGVFDMPSIIVGAIVVGVLTAGILATIFMVVPFAQDKGAQQDLGAIVTAEGTYYSQSMDSDQVKTNVGGTNSYAGLIDLRASKFLPTPADLTKDKVAAIGGDKGWIAASRSDSGEGFYVTSESTTPIKLGKVADATAAMAAAKTAASGVIGNANPDGISGYVAP